MTPPSPPRRLEPPLKGIDAWVDVWIGRWQRRGAVFRELAADAMRAEVHTEKFRNLATPALRAELTALAQRMRRREGTQPEVTGLVLAGVREAARRTVGLHPFPEQLMGALAMHRGCLAEMATGEGKTLTAGLAAVLFAWRGLPCHVITVNDYLAARDVQLLRPLYEFCGLTAGGITHESDSRARRDAYACDVTHGTSKEIAADFLRDQIALGSVKDSRRRRVQSLVHSRTSHHPNLVQRGLHAAIVDEADSLLIDEAVTPLIISASVPNASLSGAITAAQHLAAELERGADYRVAERYLDIELTDGGRQRLDALGHRLTGPWAARHRREEMVKLALTAREFYREGKEYLVDKGRVVIVDEFTGRPMPDRSWRLGLHQAVEAQQGLDVSHPQDTIARLSFQRFFRLYRQLSGMTGTAREAADELWQIYRLPVLPIPTHKPCQRVEAPARYFATRNEKLDALRIEVTALHRAGHPVLVGARSVRTSEEVAAGLTAEEIATEVLNATRLREEAFIIAEAGQAGRVTIATNMAGRGTDIRLGDGVAAHGGLFVIASEHHESGRVDRQLHGRCARQGDPGHAQTFASADDELLLRFCPHALRKFAGWLLEKKWPGGQTAAALAFRKAQSSAQRQAYRQRRRVLESDDWIEQALSFAGPEAG